MADDQPLSQEDIDAALAGLSGGGDESPIPESNAPAPEPDTSAAGEGEPMPEDANAAEQPAAATVGDAGTEAGGGIVGQDDIDALLNEVEQLAAASDAGDGDTAPTADAAPEAAAAEMAAAIAEEAAPSPPAEPAPPPPGAEPLSLPDLTGSADADEPFKSIELLKDVGLQVKIELGRSRMLVEDVLRLGEGSVVELDKLAGDPVDVYVNDRLVARGEVLVLNDNFCVRVNEIISDVWKEFQTA